MPGSVRCVALFLGMAAGVICCGALPRTALGEDLIGSVVRGLLPRPPGEVGVSVA